MNQNPKNTASNDESSSHLMTDWKWTAYALGELDSEDAARMQKLLESDPALRHELAEIRATLGLVHSVLADNRNDVALDSEHFNRIQQGISEATRPSVTSAASASEVTPSFRLFDRQILRRRRNLAALLATAALVPVAFFAWSHWMLPDSQIAKTTSGNAVSSQEMGLNRSPKASAIVLNGSNAKGENSKDAMVSQTSNDQVRGIEESEKATSDVVQDRPMVESKSEVASSLAIGGSSNGSSKHGEDPFIQKDATVPASNPIARSIASEPPIQRGVEQYEKSYVQSGAESSHVLELSASSSMRELAENIAPNQPNRPQEPSKANTELPAMSATSDAKHLDVQLESLAQGVAHNETRRSDLSLVPKNGWASGYGSGGFGGGVGGMLGGSAGSRSRGAAPLESSMSQIPLQRTQQDSAAVAESRPMIAENENGRDVGGRATDGLVSPPATTPYSDSGLAAPVDRLQTLDEMKRDQYGLPEELRGNAPEAFRRIMKPRDQLSGDRFEPIIENPFVVAQQNPLSTFSIDVDTASYSKIRQYLMQTNAVPQPRMVRIEEMINYFEYAYDGPKDDSPFAAHLAVDRCPWNTSNRLIRIGLQARRLNVQQRASANIVFLLDVSGSMNEPNKLPLVKKSLAMLTNQLTENDKVAIVVYAGAAGCVLPSTNGANKHAILFALEHLHAGGSTNGGQGIQLAYSIARENFIPGGINRVILCTDGDFNVGVTGDDALVEMMQANAKSNIFLTCLGFGMGNYNDAMMEKISNKGNGVYGMIDNEMEARRMMVEQMSGTLVTVAKDVKIQVDFNPKQVASYRLIGYEDRTLANRDFDDDRKDAGEIGAGHRVTALYEIVPVGQHLVPVPGREGEVSKYQLPASNEIPSMPNVSRTPLDGELLTLKVRYKQPEGDVSTKQEFVLNANQERPGVDLDLQWASAVAEFGLLLRHSQYAPNASWSNMLERASEATRGDAYRLECVQMMRRAAQISHR